MVTGPASVVDAVAAGEKAAVGIDRLLTGESHAFWRRALPIDTHFDPDADPVTYPRAEMVTLHSKLSRSSFAEAEESWTAAVALRETRRCLRCDFGKPCETEARRI